MAFDKPEKFLTCALAGQKYGILVSLVKGINQMTEITSVPQAGPFVSGVMNLRGKTIAVLDLRLKLGLEPMKRTKETCIIIVESSAGDLGIIVDSVSDVIELAPSQIDPPPISARGHGRQFIFGIGKLDSQLIILLDLAEALSSENLLKTLSFEKRAS